MGEDLEIGRNVSSVSFFSYLSNNGTACNLLFFSHTAYDFCIWLFTSHKIKWMCVNCCPISISLDKA